MDALIFAVGVAVLIPAHQVADHVFGQNDYEAEHKALPGEIGWIAVLSHVVKYTFVLSAMLAITIAVLGLQVTFTGTFLALLFSAVSHAVIDRRWMVRWILEKTGSPKFAKMTSPINGMYQADQALHYLCLWICALLLTV